VPEGPHPGWPALPLRAPAMSPPATHHGSPLISESEGPTTQSIRAEVTDATDATGRAERHDDVRAFARRMMPVLATHPGRIQATQTERGVEVVPRQAPAQKSDRRVMRNATKTLPIPTLLPERRIIEDFCSIRRFVDERHLRPRILCATARTSTAGKKRTSASTCASSTPSQSMRRSDCGLLGGAPAARRQRRHRPA
jgi:hypothetical protein